MPYDPVLVQPMREELTEIGVTELKTPEQVDAFLSEKEGTTLLFVNSVCGCAAGSARPGLRLALQNDKRPDRIGSVFAGQDLEATAKARGHFADFPPSSPSVVLFKDGEPVVFLPRHAIEGKDAAAVAFELVSAFDEHC